MTSPYGNYDLALAALLLCVVAPLLIKILAAFCRGVRFLLDRL